jgi:hypothetical protein
MAIVTFTTSTPTVTFNSTVSVIAGSCSGYPAVGDVETGVVFGNASEYTGTFDVPAEGDVRSGTGYGEDGTEFTGSLSAITPSGILYQRPPLTGQTVSYSNYDDGWNLANSVYAYTRPTNPSTVAELATFTTLKEDNAFGGGNKNRFTDSVGGQDYDGTGGSLVGYMIDHYTGLGWYAVKATGADFATAMSNAFNSSTLSFTDWRIPNVHEYMSTAYNTASITKFWNYAPFSNVVNDSFLTSTTVPTTTTSCMSHPNANNGTIVAALGKTATNGEYYLVRNHYV